MLELKNISKYYYSESSVTRALSCINLILPDTGFVAITGESGSGKSTLLNIISGLDVFDDGEMYIDGKPTFQYDEKEWEEYRRSRIGFVFQEYELISNYSVLDNMISSGLILGRDMDTAKEKGLNYLKQVGLEKLADHKARELSSGQKQRLSIARALAKETGIIVADEPTGNLDSETGAQIVKLLKQISRTSLVIMVTHNYDQVEHLVDRKIRIHDGEIVQDINLNHMPEDGRASEKESDTEQASALEKVPEKEDAQNKEDAPNKTSLFSKERFFFLGKTFVQEEQNLFSSLVFFS